MESSSSSSSEQASSWLPSAFFNFTSAQLCLVFLLASLALANLKVLPLAWHVRIFYGYFRYYYFNRNALPSSLAGAPGFPVLFQSTVYSSRSPLFEIDYNLHKSNSTYLTDLDIARGHHVYGLFRVGINKYISRNPPGTPTPSTYSNSDAASKPNERKSVKPGSFYPALGGVTVTFKRELKPYQNYDIRTRVLSWDRKWLYLISHFVEKGSVKSTMHSDQPWKDIIHLGSQGTDLQSAGKKRKGQAGAKAPNLPTVYAFSISKYTFKQGRITIPPTTFLQNCELVPVAPQAESDTEGDKTWAIIESKRKEGLKIAENVAGLDDGLGLFNPEEKIVFATY